MKSYLILLMFISPFLYAEEFDAIRIQESELIWKKIDDGIWKAQISGSTKQENMYVHRIRLAKGMKSSRHYHQDVKVVTVLSGSVYVGFPDEKGEWNTKKLGVGGVYTEPHNQPHFVWAKDEEVIVQVVGYGPTSRTVINPDNLEQ